MIIAYFMSALVVCSLLTLSKSIDVHYQIQPVDHFGYGNRSRQTFRQRFFVDDYYVHEKRVVKGAPIVVYFGGEAKVDDAIDGPGVGPAILTMAADRLGALILYIEHRFYGESIPYGSIEVAMDDVRVRDCLTSVQALADFAHVIKSLKKNLSSEESPVIVMGGSYGGMLAAWFRLKYPHIAVGALASSAPIVSFLELPIEKQYCSIVSEDYKETNRRCFDHISKSWALIDRVANQSDGLKILDRTFKTCSPLISVNQIKNYLVQMFLLAAQYNGRFDTMSHICDVIATASDDNILEGISRATFVSNNQDVCKNISWNAPDAVLDADSQMAWNWQACSEFINAPYACSNNSMFESHPFSLSEYTEQCRATYGVDPHPIWKSTYYGGQEAKLALKNLGSNIIFSNGLKDPWSGASILQNISESIVAITTTQGSHCLDLLSANGDDPEWLINQRRKELDILTKWINPKWIKPTSQGIVLRDSSWLSLLIISVILLCLTY